MLHQDTEVDACMRISRLVHLLLALGLGATPAFAQEAASPSQPSPTITVDLSTNPASPTSTGEPAAAVPAPAELRDPFWPVGYKPPPPKSKTAKRVEEVAKPVIVEAAPKWDEALKLVNVKGIMKRSGGYMAVINNQICSEKDTISTVYDGRKYTWRIGSIGERGVSFDKLESSKQ